MTGQKKVKGGNERQNQGKKNYMYQFVRSKQKKKEGLKDDWY